MIKKVCIFCASSNQVDKKYISAAFQTGILLVRERISVVYGGGGIGLMGAVADAILEENGQITGVIPRFMVNMKWAYTKVNQMIKVDNMYDRKKIMIKDTDAVIALPGGCGTLDELTEAITLKQLGQYTKPIIILNTDHFYDDFLKMLAKMVKERFMNDIHDQIWQVVETPGQIIPAILDAPSWNVDAIHSAPVK